MSSWVEHAKLMAVSTLGVTVTLSEINVIIQLGIALASLAYAILKMMHAFRDYRKPKEDD